MRVIERDTAERLLVEAAKRDPSRFADLYKSNFERVYAYITRRFPGAKKRRT